MTIAELEKPAEVTLDFDRTYTLEEFLELDLPEDEEYDYELLRGKLVARRKTSKSVFSICNGLSAERSPTSIRRPER
jgi:hypothetical protein